VPAWDRALGADRPVVLEIMTDPDVPPLPPHITLKQAKAFGMTLLKGDAHEAGILKQAVQHVFPKLGKS
jgi:pyruvate dehydrogenase (quinone)